MFLALICFRDAGKSSCYPMRENSLASLSAAMYCEEDGGRKRLSLLERLLWQCCYSGRQEECQWSRAVSRLGKNVDHQFMRHALRSRAGKRVWYLPQSSTTAGMYGKPAVLSGSASVCQRRHWKMQARLQGSSQDKGRLRIFQGEWLLISGR